MGVTNTNESQAPDRAQEIQQFESSKLGVKGLLDSGLTSLPPLFIHPPGVLSTLKPAGHKPKSIPTIDLSGLDSDRRPTIIEEVARAAGEFGFFQIVNHNLPAELQRRMYKVMKAFHEESPEAKAKIYRRESPTGVSFFSNIDLLHSKAASWRDTLSITAGTKLAVEEVPEVCRNEVIEWNQEIVRLGEVVLELLSEGLGLSPSKLNELRCLESRRLAAQYYPPCPQPDLTIGLTSHTDGGVITLLMQDHIGGLQVKHEDDWVDVKPVPGAFIVNIGDLLQVMSNDEYISVQHRVLANATQESRLSVVVFFYPPHSEKLYGPIPELITPEKPALYRQFTVGEFMKKFHTTELDGKTLKNYFRV